jgi:FkbM family methyltransferase
MIKLIQTKEGTTAVLKNDTHLSRWVEEHNSIKTDGLIDSVIHLIKPGDVVVDAGANIGDWTVPLAKAVGPTGAVYAFEPMPPTYACLMVNTRDHANIHAYPYALTRLNNQIVSINLRENVGSSNIGDAQIDDLQCFYVHGSRLDSFGLDRLDFMKVDVEGAEMELLYGASNVIKKFRPRVVCELNRGTLQRFNTEPVEIITFFAYHGYVTKMIDPRHTLDMEMVDVLFVPKEKA